MTKGQQRDMVGQRHIAHVSHKTITPIASLSISMQFSQPHPLSAYPFNPEFPQGSYRSLAPKIVRTSVSHT